MREEQRYAIHLNNLRKKYHLTVELFCHGICDARSYRRYLSGERVLPPEMIFQFCDKLHISINEFFYSFLQNDKEEYQSINKLYHLAQRNKIEEFFEEAKKLDPYQFSSEMNQKYYQYCVIHANFLGKRDTVAHILEQLSNLIDYPACLRNEAYNFVDILCLSLITSIEVQSKETKALTRLKAILNNPKLQYLSSDVTTLMPTIYASVSLYSYRLGDIQSSLDIAIAGIKHANNIHNNSQHYYLHYMASYCYYKLGDKEKADIHALKCLYSTILSEQPHLIEYYQKMLMKDYDYDVFDLSLEYKDLLMKKDR